MMWILVIICIISSVQPAPVDTNSLFMIVESDNRTAKLREHKFVEECKETEDFSKSLCYAMYDVALSYDSQKLEFNRADIAYDNSKFCAALAEVVPDTPDNEESTTAFKDQAKWFKDTLKSDEECSINCFYKDRLSYEMKLLPVCQFLFKQFSFLHDIQESSENQKSAESNPTETKSIDAKVEPIAVAQAVPAVNKVPEAFDSASQAPSAQASPQALAPLPPATNASNVKVTRQETAASVNVENTEALKLNATDAQTKALDQTSQSTTVEAKKVETTKDNPAKPVESVKKVDPTKPAEVPKVVEPAKTDDTKDDPAVINLENNDISPNLFDENGDNAAETPDKDETKNDFEAPYREDDEEMYNDDAMARNNNLPEVKIPQEPEPTLDDVPHKKIEVVDFEEDPDSNFFTYLCALMFLCVLLYILAQNRAKILALLLEGRRGNGRRGSRERTRGGSKAAYSKLDCNLEEAITSKKSLSGKSMDIIY